MYDIIFNSPFSKPSIFRFYGSMIDSNSFKIKPALLEILSTGIDVELLHKFLFANNYRTGNLLLYIFHQLRRIIKSSSSSAIFCLILWRLVSLEPTQRLTRYFVFISLSLKNIYWNLFVLFVFFFAPFNAKFRIFLGVILEENYL